MRNRHRFHHLHREISKMPKGIRAMSLEEDRRAQNGRPRQSANSFLPPITHPGTHLNYVDFWPKCLNNATKVKHAIFESFDDLVEKSNRWLDSHPGTEIITCQTLEKKVCRLSDVTADTVLFRPELGVTSVYIKGLRIWYSKCDSESQTAHGYLAYADALPQWLNQGEEHSHKFPEYESLSAVLERVNRDLAERPLEGRIVTVETVCIQIAKPHWNEPLDVLKSCWIDGYTRHKYYFLRVFYRMGPSAQETIGIADFVPELLSETHAWDPMPEYEGLDVIVNRATEWLQHVEDIRVTNLQTLDTTYLKRTELGGQRLDTLRTINHKIESRPRVMFLRVAYILSKIKANNSIVLPRITCHTFVPAVLVDHSCCGSKDYEFEKMRSKVDRVNFWLHEACAKVLCVETVAVPLWFINQPDSRYRTASDGEWFTQKNSEQRHKLIHFIRIFVDGNYREPDPWNLPPPPQVRTAHPRCNLL